MTRTPASLFAHARERFRDAGLAEPVLDARLLVGGLLGLSRTAFLTAGDMPVSAERAAVVQEGIERRLRREPVHRILGRRDFFDLSLRLSAETLEPRPDTEILV